MNPLKNFYFILMGFAALLLIQGCASTGPLKGVTPGGDKVYLGPLPIESTQEYKDYLKSRHTEVDKQRYLFQRLKSADKLEFFHDGAWYNSTEAYRGGMWLMRERYKKDQDTRDFIRKFVERSEDTGKLHLVKFPDGSIQIGSYLLYNELDLLENAVTKDLKS